MNKILIALLVVTMRGTYAYDHREHLRVKQRDREQTAALHNYAKAEDKRAKAVKQQNRLIASLALCAGAVAGVHLVTRGKGSRIQIGTGVLAAGACLPAVLEVKNALE